MADTNTTTKLLTPKARVAFPNLFEAKSFNGQPAKYNVVLVFDKAAQATPEFQRLKKAANDTVKNKWGDKPPKGLKNPFRSGADKEDVAGFEPDDIFITVSSKSKPKIVDRNKVNGVFPEIIDEDRIYPGCFVRASVNPYAYDNNGNRGVSFGLNNVQFLEDGERIAGGRGKPEEEFDSVGGENITDATESADSVF